MKKYIPIYLYGTIIILQGIFLLFSKDSSFHLIKYSLGISLIFGAVIAFISAFSRKRRQVQFAYHEMHAIAMLVYGLSVLFFSRTLADLTYITAFLLIFYAFSEVIFCNWIYNLGQKVLFKIVLVRVFLGFIVGMGALVAMNLEDIQFEILGILFIMVGINIILYVPIMKSGEEIIGFHQ
jgi:uncharacterized membrane protein HdeD (DUF308 family)